MYFSLHPVFSWFRLRVQSGEDHCQDHVHYFEASMSDRKDQITAMLVEMARDNQDTARQDVVGALLPLVYEELRAMAQRQLKGQRPNHTLNTTALVHEAYLKLVHQNNASWQNRAHFLSVASIAMRQILINYAERRRALKRGGDQAIATFDEAFMGKETIRAEELLALDEALDRLSAINERQGKVVTYHFFGGLTHQEAADILGVSEPTVRRDWRIAKAWLTRELTTDS